MSKPLDRAVVVLKAVKAWSVWAAHASECPIKGQGDESRDLVEQKWALMDQGTGLRLDFIRTKTACFLFE